MLAPGRRILILSLVLIVVATWALAGCGGATEEPPAAEEPTEPTETPAEEGPQYGGTLVIANYADITHLCPFLSTDGTSNIVNRVIHQGLVGYRGNNEITPLLAEEWDISDDGLTWTFHLREGVKWHDGTEFTAEDVKYTYDLIMDPATKSVRADYFGPVDKVEVVDDYTLKIVTKEPYASMLDKVGNLGIVAKHHVEEFGLEGYNRNPLGTGPFKYKEWKPEEKIVLERFDDYWEGKPYLDAVEYVVISEPSVRQMAMETGEVHYNWWQVSEEDIPRMMEDESITVLQYLQTDFHFFGLNCQHRFFDDYRARQAIAYAIDKEAIVQNFAQYTGIIADGPYSEAYGYYYNPDVLTQIRYDPDKALEMLQELGWEKGDDGYLYNEDGELFEYGVLLKQGDEVRRNILVMIQSWMADIGIKMNIQEMEWSLMLEKITATRDFDAAIIQFGASPDPDHYTIFHSQGGFWLMQYTNDRVDELLERGRAVLEPEERKKFYDEYQEITSKELPVIFLWHSLRTTMLNSRFQGMTSEPAGQMQLIHQVWDTEAGK